MTLRSPLARGRWPMGRRCFRALLVAALLLCFPAANKGTLLPSEIMSRHSDISRVSILNCDMWTTDLPSLPHDPHGETPNETATASVGRPRFSGRVRRPEWHRRRRESWDFMFNLLLKYGQQYGHVSVPQKSPDSDCRCSNCGLGQWANNQRAEFKLHYKRWAKNDQTPSRLADETVYERNRLFAERSDKLLRSGFVFEQREDVWDTIFERLLDFYREHGHTLVTARHPDKTLVGWVRQQRFRWRRGMLPQDKRDRLQTLDFSTKPRQCNDWDANFHELILYKQHTGMSHVHSNLGLHEDEPSPQNSSPQRGSPRSRMPGHLREEEPPGGSPEHRKMLSQASNPVLARWIQKQRKAIGSGELHPVRAARLRAVDFAHDLWERDWDKWFAELLMFKQRTGHCAIVKNGGVEQALIQWVRRQRHEHLRGRMLPGRLQRLSDLDFEFSPKILFWEQRFAELEAFRAEHGHVDVPDPYPEQTVFATWMVRQRQLHRRGDLEPERERRLRLIGCNLGKRTAPFARKFRPRTSSRSSTPTSTSDASDSDSQSGQVAESARVGVQRNRPDSKSEFAGIEQSRDLRGGGRCTSLVEAECGVGVQDECGLGVQDEDEVQERFESSPEPPAPHGLVQGTGLYQRRLRSWVPEMRGRGKGGGGLVCTVKS